MSYFGSTATTANQQYSQLYPFYSLTKPGHKPRVLFNIKIRAYVFVDLRVQCQTFHSLRTTNLCGIHPNCPIRLSAPGITNCSRKRLDSCSLPDEPSPLLMSNQKIQPEILKEREGVLKNKDWNKDNDRARSGQRRAHR